MTKVSNMRTGEDVFYSLPPDQAVAQAYRQLELGDYNWWRPRALPPIEEGKSFFFCGHFASRKERAWELGTTHR